ncbi:MAG: hypothetical protein QQN63_14580, partial [Nitrosopumilus sp.]
SDAVKRIVQETLDLRAEVERLEGIVKAYLVDAQFDAGMEQAAKILHDQGYFKSAAAIRADKERGDE